MILPKIPSLYQIFHVIGDLVTNRPGKQIDFEECDSKPSFLPALFGENLFFGANSIMKTLNSYLRTFMVFASKVWTFMCFVFRKQTRAVSISFANDLVLCLLPIIQTSICSE